MRGALYGDDELEVPAVIFYASLPCFEDTRGDIIVLPLHFRCSVVIGSCAGVPVGCLSSGMPPTAFMINQQVAQRCSSSKCEFCWIPLGW